MSASTHPGNPLIEALPRLDLARVWPNLDSLAPAGLLGRCWEHLRRPALARSYGASDKRDLSTDPARATCFLRLTRRTCQPSGTDRPGHDCWFRQQRQSIRGMGSGWM